MNRILILGAGGMAGHVIKKYLEQLPGYEVFGTYRNTGMQNGAIQVDVFNTKRVEEVIDSIRPAIIINCIGSLLRESARFPHKAIFANAYFPHFLAQKATAIDVRLITLSTDCVFSGRTGNYAETATRDAKDLYGQSKSLGEVDTAQHLTIRTSIIGPELKENGEGLFDWFMHRTGAVGGYKEVWWSGVTTLELAKFIGYCIPLAITGIVHLTNGIPVNKYDLLRLIQIVFGRQDINLLEDRSKQLNKSLQPSEKILSYAVPGYEAMLREMRDFMEQNKIAYPAYAAYL